MVLELERRLAAKTIGQGRKEPGKAQNVRMGAGESASSADWRKTAVPGFQQRRKVWAWR